MMRRLSVLLTLLVGAVAVPAFADVTVTATITKDKDVFVLEEIEKFKIVLIDVTGPPPLHGAAEAQALANVLNTGNEPSHPGFPETPANFEKDALITNSIGGGTADNPNSGIVQFNQDVGNMVNQGNLVSAGVTTEGFTEAQAEVEQVNTLNISRTRETLVEVTEGGVNGLDPDRTAVIQGSIIGNEGVVQVNQHAGNMNNQTNALALALGVDSQVALSEAALGQVNTDNIVQEFNTVKLNSITDSINGNTGIVQFNQSTGNMNNQGSVVAFAATISSATIVPPTQTLPTFPTP